VLKTSKDTQGCSYRVRLRIHKGFVEEVYGKMIAKSLQLRERVDYDVYYRATREEAESTVRDAERFVERIKKAIDEITRGR
jgi:uncharacterized protein (UPF0332 family)